MNTMVADSANRVDYKKSFYYKALEAPAYGYDRRGEVYYPTKSEILREYFKRLNIFSTKKNWIAGWFFAQAIWVTLCIYLYIVYHLSWPTFLFVAAVILFEGYTWELIHHRGFTHGAFKFRNQFWTQVFKIINTPLYPEEIYHFAHLCHHQFSDKVGDPYCPKGGLFYIYFTDINHQQINRHLSEAEYLAVRQKLSQYCLFLNSYKQYLKWGTLAHPALFISKSVIVCSLKFAFIYWLLGLAFASAFMVGLFLVGINYKAVNYLLHDNGKRHKRPGVEFNKDDAINTWWAIITIGQWHGHHHLYPQSANTGLFKHQIDLPFLFLMLLEKLGIVTDVRDSQARFQAEYLSR